MGKWYTRDCYKVEFELTMILLESPLAATIKRIIHTNTNRLGSTNIDHQFINSTLMFVTICTEIFCLHIASRSLKLQLIILCRIQLLIHLVSIDNYSPDLYAKKETITHFFILLVHTNLGWSDDNASAKPTRCEAITVFMQQATYISDPSTQYLTYITRVSAYFHSKIKWRAFRKFSPAGNLLI